MRMEQYLIVVSFNSSLHHHDQTLITSASCIPIQTGWFISCVSTRTTLSSYTLVMEARTEPSRRQVDLARNQVTGSGISL